MKVRTGSSWLQLVKPFGRMDVSSASRPTPASKGNQGFRFHLTVGRTRQRKYRTAILTYSWETPSISSWSPFPSPCRQIKRLLREIRWCHAHMWYNIAASQGYKYATKHRDLIAGKMTPADISTAKKLARKCIRKNYKGCWVEPNRVHDKWNFIQGK